MSAQIHPEATVAERWSLGRRLGFRFLVIYFVLFAFPFPIGWIPGTDAWFDGLYQPVNGLTLWFGRDVLGLAVTAIDAQNGSGDTTLSYVFVLLSALVAALGSAVWSLLARRRLAHPTAHAVLRGVVRYFLALMLISYGLVKVIKTQFPDPTDGKLLQQVGDLSPMGLLWLFMGASHGYTVFAGIMELVPAALLLFRRTTTLGALLLLGVMGNVVMLNLCYDVPVKIGSLHYLALGVWLLVPQLGALWRFFSGGEARLRGEIDVLPGRWRWLRVGLLLLVAAFTVHNLVDTLERYHQRGDGAPRPAYVGVFAVESHAVDAHEAPAERRWKEVRFRGTYAAIVPETGEPRGFALAHDAATGTMTLTPYDGHGGPYRLVFTQEGELVRMGGVVDGSIHVITARKRDTSRMLLRTRGFHWVNEVPFNR